MPFGSPFQVRAVLPVIGLTPKTVLPPEVTKPGVAFVESMALVMGPRKTVTPSQPEMYSSKPVPTEWACFISCDASRVKSVVFVSFQVMVPVRPRVFVDSRLRQPSPSRVTALMRTPRRSLIGRL